MVNCLTTRSEEHSRGGKNFGQSSNCRIDKSGIADFSTAVAPAGVVVAPVGAISISAVVAGTITDSRRSGSCERSLPSSASS